jgi:rhodanese-related sulfurtransferase
MTMIKACFVCLSLAVGLLVSGPVGVFAADARIASEVESKSLSKKKQTRLGLYVTAEEAGDLLKDNPDILLIDVRTRAEAMFVGMPVHAAKNIPFLQLGSYAYDKKKKTYKLDPNPAFAEELAAHVAKKGGDKSTTLILMCRSGTRSAKAANELTKLGYAHAYSMVDGFEGDADKDGRRTLNGWKNADHPWTTKLEHEHLYKEPK